MWITLNLPSTKLYPVQVNVFPGSGEQTGVFEFVQDGIERSAAQAERFGEGETVVRFSAVGSGNLT